MIDTKCFFFTVTIGTKYIQLNPANIYAPLPSFRQFPYLHSKPFFGGIPAPLLDNCLKLVVGGEYLTPA
jgi:hypothetical protein